MRLTKQIVQFLIFVLLIINIPLAVYAEAPNKPTNLQLRQTEKTEAQVSWDAPEEGEVIDYLVSVNNGELNTISEDTIEELTNLIIGKIYTVTVKARNNDGYSEGITKQFTVGGNATDIQLLTTLSDQKMHGNYQNNTNTCSNCHSTHKSKSKIGLLKKANVYDTCISCHDGSLGFYNVFETDVTKDNGAGTFRGSHAGNMSIHLSTGDVSIDAAPGSSLAKNEEGEFLDGMWSKDFTCTSCHSPHGSSVDRLLQSDPNGYSRIERRSVNGVYYGGLISAIITVDNAVNYVDIPSVISGWGTPLVPDGDEDQVPQDAPEKNYKALKFPIDSAAIEDTKFEDLEENSGWIIQIYKFDKYLGTWIPVKFKQVGPFSGDGLDLLIGPTKTDKLNGWKLPVDPDNVDDGEKLNEGYLSIGWYGYVKVPNDVANKILNVTNIATLFDFEFSNKVDNLGEGENYRYNYRINHELNILDQSELDASSNPTDKAKKVMSNFNQFNEWCASCHVGFNISNEQKELLDSTNVYTHHSSSEDDQLPCVQCHYSHGTDATWMKDKNGDFYNVAFAKIVEEYKNKPRIYAGSIGLIDGSGDISELEAQNAAKNYLTDQNFTSALKRYSNESSCYRCHGNDLPSN